MPMNTMEHKKVLSELYGLWMNPLTGNKYLFTPGINDELKGEIGIIQAGTEDPINLNITLHVNAKGISAEVEGILYTITMEEGPQKAVSIIFPDNYSIRLVKPA
jgi:hypothetical protein